MAKLTIEIDMDDPQETWDALYRRIEQFGEESSDQPDQPAKPAANQATYDLLLDPEHLRDVGDFFAVFGSQDRSPTRAQGGRGFAARSAAASRSTAAARLPSPLVCGEPGCVIGRDA